MSLQPTGNAVMRYYEKDQLVGTRRLYCCGYSASAKSPVISAYWPHLAFFCPTCGEIWARGIYDYDFDYEPRSNLSALHWLVESRRCPEHGDGTLLSGYLHHLSDCDKALLAREALVLSLNPHLWRG